MSSTNEDFEIVGKLESEISSKEARANTDRLAQLLHDDFEEFGKSGEIYTKAALLVELPTWDYQPIAINDMRFTRLAKNALIVKYLSKVNGVEANRSSVWVKESGAWKMIFHQGTRC